MVEIRAGCSWEKFDTDTNIDTLTSILNDTFFGTSFISSVLTKDHMPMVSPVSGCNLVFFSAQYKSTANQQYY